MLSSAGCWCWEESHWPGRPGAIAEQPRKRPKKSAAKRSASGRSSSRASSPEEPRGPETPPRHARLRHPRELWGRRAVKAGAALLAAAAIGGGVIALTGGEDEDDPPTEAELAQAEAEQLAALLSENVQDKRAGIVVRHPADWKGTRKPPIVNVESPDRCVVVSVSAPASADQSQALLRSSIDLLASESGNAQPQRLAPAKIDGLTARGALVPVRSRGGNAVVVRQSVAKGKRYAYLVQTVYRQPPCADSRTAADLIVQNLELSK